MTKRLLVFLFSCTLFFLARGIVFAQTSSRVDVNLSLSQPGVSANGVVLRCLYKASPSAPTSCPGPQAIGSFTAGSVVFPFSVSASGNYTFVFSYYQTAYRRLIDVKIDGVSPSGWAGVELWPNSPDYSLWGDAPQIYGGSPPSVTWALPGAVPLSSGSHTVEFDFHDGGTLISGAYFTTGSAPQNSSKPWFVVGNSIFPALDFSNHQVTTLADGRVRVVFNGTWTNLAPGDVSFSVKTSTMLRSGKLSPLYSVTSISTPSTLTLTKGQSTPFSLTVESNAPPQAGYSELIRLDLSSNDVSNLSKPYLMSAGTGFLPIQTTAALKYVKDYNAGGFAPVDGTDLTHLFPSRQTLGFANGRYERSDVSSAFVYGLASSPTHIVTKSGFDLTAWAINRPNSILSDASRTNSTPYKDSPLSTINASVGQGASATMVKQVMQYYANEVPYYPVMRWDIARPFILPATQYEFGGVTLLTSYVKLLQQNGMTDDEHFRFLHNVILPLFVSYRDDLRVTGTLAQSYGPGQNSISFQTANGPFMDIANRIGQWVRLGAGASTEYIHLDTRAGGGNTLLFYSTVGLGVPKLTHPAGEPFASYHMREAYELEGTDIWTFLAAAAASRDSAVQEQAAEWLNVIYSTQNVYRDDGSFADEPGSYGWGAFEYADLANQIFAFIGKSAIPAYDSLRNVFLNAFIMWNDFPFSDGSYPMLNGGGAVNQLTRNPDAINLFKMMFPERTDLTNYYSGIISQENSRTAGSMVNNRSFKVDGWGYAMLRGPGSWDTRMETLLSSKHLMYYPGDHVSDDALGIVAFANGTILTPRYGYDWRGYPYLLKNMVTIDRKESAHWGDFVHFDPDLNMPSAVAVTDMSGSWSNVPGMAHEERWNVQLPEYLFDIYIVKPFDGKVHRFEWGYRNMGELAISNPLVTLSTAVDPGGAPWDPFGVYITNTGHMGQQFTANGLWQGDWTMNEGSIMQNATYAWPPKGSKMRLTMEGVSNTKVTTAWLTGPARNQTTNLRQDFIVAERNDTQSTYVDTLEPIGVGKSGFVQSVVTTANATDNSRSVKVTTVGGTDWFLVGTQNFKGSRGSRAVGPFTTDAALAVVRIKNGQVVACKYFGGTSFGFNDSGISASTCQQGVSPSSTPAPVAGDTNGDGKVDGIDYVTVVNHFGQTTSRGAVDGDVNGDGKVDINDLNLVISKLQ